MILAQQKRLEIQLEESKVQYQTTSEAKDAVEAEKVRLEASVKEFQAKLESLEKLVSESDDSPPPWETDEELKAMKPTDIRSCFQVILSTGHMRCQMLLSFCALSKTLFYLCKLLTRFCGI